jgi:hypothetical protein
MRKLRRIRQEEATASRRFRRRLTATGTAAVMDKLPPHIEKRQAPAFGLECCDIGGEAVNTGRRQIVNATSGLSLGIPEIALHFMQHGSFSYLGDIHPGGRTEIATLVRILELPSACGDLGIAYDPIDLNRDGKVDMADFTEFAQRRLDSIESTTL